jgi:SAM-dependent methyltransferase
MLLDDAALEGSDVVANSTMNRDRRLAGTNSYTKELRLDPLAFLLARADDACHGRAVAWLDACCGAGRALHDAADALATTPDAARVRLIGVDLVDLFEHRPDLDELVAPLLGWTPPTSFDLITCVHGLHYVGDKLGAITRLAGWLGPDGLLIADFDPASVRLRDGRPAGRALSAALRSAGFELDTRRHRLRLTGGRETGLPYRFPFRFIGADAAAGPNYTGQPAVHSYYEPDTGR